MFEGLMQKGVSKMNPGIQMGQIGQLGQGGGKGEKVLGT